MLRDYAGLMNKSNVWTIVGVVVAVIVAWFVVSALFSVLWFIAKLALVASDAAKTLLVGMRTRGTLEMRGERRGARYELASQSD